jgi:hypothetical protein
VSAVSHEQRHPEAGLQRLDLLRQRRRGDVHALSGTAEVQLLGDGDEVAQLAKLHRSDDTGPC